jgi:2-oxo-4-hydroxy-4-carboxy-5-ureidoimidazoline decarboxylase
MNLSDFNELSFVDAAAELSRCCGSSAWVVVMAARRPFGSLEHLLATANEVWARLTPADWKEAFAHHPKIGEVESLKQKFGSTPAWATDEQSGARNADEKILRRLAAGNAEYEKKFGYIFIVCATGKTAAEMCELLYARLPNKPDAEILIAAEEQRRITRLRLEKLLSP